MTPDEFDDLEPGLYEIEYTTATGDVRTLQAVKLGSRRYFVLWDKYEAQEYTRTEFAELVRDCKLIYEF